MDKYARIATLENEIEAGLLDSILTERNIPHVIRSYHDIVYNGIYQTVRGWGYVGSLESYRQEIIDILMNIRKSPSGDI
ncbi:MAG: hypothetical protein PWR06_1689 [Thermoanaerobacteraceae bacterium]|jgi:hypothetical protein|nr:hypothetical protein [Thermoanaerobacteraceae bacterium]MDN5312581.1 hypothetical protein [Thermoanaerobacteraceae bacterium]RKL63216.1 hypothetical protein DXT63_07365 [Thermoanaerobacteraceae bacterium SP2]